MNLLELTEPIFQYACRLNRLARKSGGTSPSDTSFLAKAPGAPAAPRLASLDYAVVRSEVKAMFEDLIQKSNSDMKLNSQAKKMELPLLFFVAGVPLMTLAVADPFTSLVTSEVSYPGRRRFFVLGKGSQVVRRRKF